MEYEAMEQYWVWLASVEGMTPKRFYRLLSHFEDARCVWDNVDDTRKFLPERVGKALKSARSERYFYALFDRLERMDIAVISRLSPLYPARLTDIFDPPPMLYVQGSRDLSDEKMLGIVGSRRASYDGKRAASDIAQGLCRVGKAVVVSGMARGIDSSAHAGALKAGGKTIAVTGSGLDIIYPPENAKLKREILETGGSVISEYAPGTPPYATNFPARNRIISGLSEGVLVVEGRINSGAMITVNFANEQGRDVFAVPGSIYSPQCEGPNQLIFDGAMPVRDHWDLLERFGWAQRPSGKAEKKQTIELSGDEKTIVDLLKIEQTSFDELVKSTGFNTADLNSLLTILQLRGIIKQLPGKIYRA